MIERLNDYGTMEIHNKVNEIIDELNLQEENKQKILREFDMLARSKEEATVGKEYVNSTMMVERDGDEVEVDIDGWVEYSVEKRYGEDADGNRGIKVVFIEDVSDITAYDCYKEEDVKFNKDEEETASEILGSKFLDE